MKLLTIYKQWRPNIPYSSVHKSLQLDKKFLQINEDKISYNTVHKSLQLDQKILQINLTVPIIIIKILYQTDQGFL